MGELLQKRHAVTESLFKEYDTSASGELSAVQLQTMHANLRQGGIGIAQVKASMLYACVDPTVCESSELFDILQEMDRRYYLLQDFRWEFAMLDRQQRDVITEDQARFMFEAVHGQLFSKRHWEKFLKSRPVPGTGVSFAEIEVDLCNIPSQDDAAYEEMAEQQAKEERARHLEEKKLLEARARTDRLAKMEAARRAKEEEESSRRRAEDTRRQGEEDELKKEREAAKQRKLDEVQGKKEAEDREEERRMKLKPKESELERDRQRELEIIEVQQALEAQREIEKKAKEIEEQERRDRDMTNNAEEEAELATAKEKEAEVEALRAKEAIANATDAASKRAAEEMEKAAKEKAKRERHDRIRKELKVAIKKKDRDLIAKSVEEFKTAKLADTEGDLHKAERILMQFQAKEELVVAMEQRNLERLEKAINFVKKNSLEAHMPHEMIRANKMLLGLKRLKRLKDEILNLKQSTVAEIRSYNKPPMAVHMVMISTCLLLGNKEKPLKDWKAMQALIGRTGKEGLKRRVLECDPTKLQPNVADRAKELLKEFDLEQVRDVSAGAAVFYAWTLATITEIEDIARQREDGLEPVAAKGGHKEIKHELSSGTLTVKM